MGKSDIKNFEERKQETSPFEHALDKSPSRDSGNRQASSSGIPLVRASRFPPPMLLIGGTFPLPTSDGFLPIPLLQYKLLRKHMVLADGLRTLVSKLLGIHKSNISIDSGILVTNDLSQGRLCLQLIPTDWNSLPEDEKTLISSECSKFIHCLELKPDKDSEAKNSGVPTDTSSVATEFKNENGALHLGAGSQLVAGKTTLTLPRVTQGRPEQVEATETIAFSRHQVSYANYDSRICCLMDIDIRQKLELSFEIDKYLQDLLAAEKGRWLVAGTYEKKTFKNGDVEQKLVGKLSIQTTL